MLTAEQTIKYKPKYLEYVLQLSMAYGLRISQSPSLPARTFILMSMVALLILLNIYGMA